MKHRTEPLAIVGIGLRFPGGINTPEAFWEALCQGRDLIADVPPDRWNVRSFYDANRGKTGKVYTTRGGFLEDVSGFDPEFFGISPFEAGFMDPQQRLMLEVAWEALEDGGLVPAALAGSKTGVFVGASLHEYENMNSDRNDHSLIGTYSATGMGMSLIANRISYLLDLKGPSLSLDTACSSSLVAVHLACQSIWSGETDAGIAGGVQVLLRPDSTMSMCKGGFLSPDGICKSFDARADGYVRSEGVGAVVIEPLSTALAKKRCIYALIRGTAVNQDGRSKGLTVPDEQAQMTVITEALHAAGVAPENVQYVEAHGTGTPVGDPVEARSIGTVLGRPRPAESPLLIGSAKTNLGHTESTAGVVGLIKAALMLTHGMIPPNLHFREPHPRIPFDELRIRVPTTLEPWPDPGANPRIAGVNSFGFGGTNAHAVLQQAPIEACCATGCDGPIVIPLSARSDKASKAVAARLAEFIEDTPRGHAAEIGDIAFSAALHKAHHPFRAALVVSSKEQAASSLRAFAAGESAPHLVSGEILATSKPKIAFVFSGMGQQWPGMGRALFRREPVFKRVIEECGALFADLGADWSLAEELCAEDGHSRIHETRIAQPCIFSVQAASIALLRSWGIEPEFVVGHSIGEVAACFAAGILTLPEAVSICHHRSRLQQTLAGTGGMLAVGLSEQTVGAYLAGFLDRISIAAVNTADSVTLAGELPLLQDLAARLEEDQIFHRFLRVEVPYHSPVVERICGDLRESLKQLQPREGTVPFVSTVTGGLLAGSAAGADYWAENARRPVFFRAACQTLAAREANLFLDIGAHPVLSASLAANLAEAGTPGVVIPTLKRAEDDVSGMLRAIGRLYVSGCTIDWKKLCPDQAQFVRLPTYPWQNTPCWKETEESKRYRLGNPCDHPLLGERMDAGTTGWQARIDLSRHTFLNDHVVRGEIVFPAAGFVEMAIEACRAVSGKPGAVLENIELKKPLLLRHEPDSAVQVTIEGGERFSIFGKPCEGPGEWTLHVRGEFGAGVGTHPVSDGLLDEIVRRCPRRIPVDRLYDEFRAKGLVYRGVFRGIEEIGVGNGEAFGWIVSDPLSESESSVAGVAGYNAHPALLDACFQVMAAFGGDGTFLPLRFERVAFHAPFSSRIFCHARLHDRDHKRMQGDLSVFAPDGRVLLEIEGFLCQRMVEQQDLQRGSIAEMLYEDQWVLDEECYLEGAVPNQTLPDLQTLKTELEPFLRQIWMSEDRRRKRDCVRAELERLSVLYIATALRNLLGEPTGEARFTLPELRERSGIKPTFHPLLDSYLQLLARHGVCSRIGDTVVLSEASQGNNGGRRWRELLAAYPAWRCELSHLDHFGTRLDDMLRGEAERSFLVLSDSSQTRDQLFKDSPTFRPYNQTLRAVAKVLVERFPDGHPIRILEIGAGIGSWAASILPLLPRHRTRYCFTDVSEEALLRAQVAFSHFEGMEFKRFDLRAKPEEQDMPLKAFDLVLSSLVLDRVDDQHKAIDTIFRMTADGGLYVLLEPTSGCSWYTFVHGPAPEIDWIKVLTGNGFCEAGDLLSALGHTGLEFRLLAAKKASMGEERASAPSTGPANAGRYVLLADAGGLAQRLARFLSMAGLTDIHLVFHGDAFEESEGSSLVMDPRNPDHVAELVRRVWPDGGKPPTLVNLWNLASSGECVEFDEKAFESCMSTVKLVQEITRRRGPFPAVWTVTNGAQVVNGNGHPSPTDDERPAISGGLNTIGLDTVGLRSVEDLPHQNGTGPSPRQRAGSSLEQKGTPSLRQAPLWGLARVIATEHPDIRSRIVDLSPFPSDVELGHLARVLLNPGDEDELALREKYRFVRRLVRKPFAERRDVGRTLAIVPGRGIEGLAFVERPRHSPGHGEVEIQVMAAGLNMKDVLKATGALDAVRSYESSLLSKLGFECSGVVTAVGEGVSAFQVGDEVMGLATECFADLALARVETLCRKPAGMDFSEAAAMPVAYLTAHYALVRLARIRQGERILIHSATGGVGLAAIRIALNAGAEVYATAGNEEKREFLRAMGIRYVGDSRSVAFAEEIRRLTDGQGVDIVLNTLPGKAVKKGMAALKPFTGRFVDITNLYNDALRVHAPENGIALHSFDMERMSGAFLADLWKDIEAGIEAGVFGPLPFRTYPRADLKRAFKDMSRGVHIGKCVLEIQKRNTALPTAGPDLPVCADGSYLVTGGLKGFGLATAQWLASRGARHLVLVGRSGASSDEARVALEEFERQGVSVTVESVDVTREREVTDLIQRIRQAFPPLKGIVHAAMVLSDAPIAAMDETKMHSVIAPKVLGAWNLHKHTRGDPLDFFLCYSSISAAIGNAGQGNYVAANLFLESLARFRSMQGLPALTVGFGPIGAVGYVARHAEVKEHLLRFGVGEVELQQAWKAIELGLREGCPVLGFYSADWETMARYNPRIRTSPTFSRLVPRRSEDEGSEGMGLQNLLQLPPEERKIELAGLLSREIARFLGTDLSRVPLEKPISELGIDSFAVVELIARIERMIGLRLPQMVFFRPGLTVMGLAKVVEADLMNKPSEGRSNGRG